MPQEPILFDRKLLRARRSRAVAGGSVDFLVEHVAKELAERLSVVLRTFELAADIGTPGDALRRELRKRSLTRRIVAVYAAPVADRSEWTVAADEEALPFADGTLHLAVSAMSFQFVNDLPGALVQIRRALKPDGLLLCAMAGGDTLTELRESFAAAESEIEDGISPHVAPFADVRTLGALLQRAGFALPVTDVDRLTVRYPDVFALMRDLRGMGATNILVERRRRPLRRATLLRMAEIYGERFSDPDGRLRATFDIVWLSGWAPHESQQRPLKPGTARHRLSDALGVPEWSAGEKPQE